MKFIEKLSTKRFFGSRSKKHRTTVSCSNDPSSFSSGTLSSSSSSPSPSPTSSPSDSFARKLGSEQHKAGTTPKRVLPEISAGLNYELLLAFKLLDRDNDGVVLRSELEPLLIRLGTEPPTQEEVSLMLSEVDSDGDGCITLDALMSRVGNSACEPACEPELKETFDFFDADHDGKITAEELLHVFTSLGDEGCTLDDCRRMIASVDKNEDGFVCFEDFSRMMELQR